MSHLITLQARAEDNSLAADGSGTGNINTPSTPGIDVITLTIDDNPPTGTLTYPAASAGTSSATVQMSGTATDITGDPAGSGVSIIQVEISTGTGASKFDWTGSTWSANANNNLPTWITTTTANPWYYTIPANALVSGNKYYLRFQLYDAAGNLFTSQVSTFTYDTTAPTVTISTPVANNFYSLIFISTPFAGTAVDNGTNATGVSTVTVQIADVETGFTFNGSTYAAGSTFLAAQGSPANWTYNNAALFFLTDHRYDVTAQATDNAGNVATLTNRFIYDVAKPTTTVTSPSGIYITALPAIAGSATDNLGQRLYQPFRHFHQRRSGRREASGQQLVEWLRLWRYRSELRDLYRRQHHHHRSESLGGIFLRRIARHARHGNAVPHCEPLHRQSRQRGIRTLERKRPRRRRPHGSLRLGDRGVLHHFPDQWRFHPGRSRTDGYR